MRIARAGLAALALALAACAEQGEQGGEPEQRAFAEPEQKRGDVYVARYVPVLGPDGRPAPARLALFHGSYGVANRCLVFDMGGSEPALVRFPTGTRVDIYADHVVIGETVHRFGSRKQRGGGFDGAGAHDRLVEPPPENCRYSVIGP